MQVSSDSLPLLHHWSTDNRDYLITGDIKWFGRAWQRALSSIGVLKALEVVVLLAFFCGTFGSDEHCEEWTPFM